MKVTALMPDEMIQDLRDLTQAKNLTEALKQAVGEWVAYKQLQEKHLQIRKQPLQFHESAESLRKRNRR